MADQHFIISSSSRGPNGGIDGRIKLSCALRYMAGGDPLDVMISHCLSHAVIFDCIWQAVDAINNCRGLDTLSYPKCHQRQREIARGFQHASDIGIQDGSLNFSQAVSNASGSFLSEFLPSNCCLVFAQDCIANLARTSVQVI